MKTQMVDFGIDLGTSNSSIALMRDGNLKIFKNNLNCEITPSVIRIDSKGTLFCGKKAYDRLEDDPENTCAEFKRWMGRQQSKVFKAAGKTLSPEEISSEVLKSLKSDVFSSINEDVRSAVITVPALFEIVQCEATMRSAKMAGIEETTLMQEPIAAAVAYGVNKVSANSYFLVYDLGGGTFDLSLISIRDGKLSVIDHEGDNFLGGKDFDWLIVENLLIPVLQEQYALTDLKRGNTSKYGKLLAKLKYMAEDAKIEISRSESTTISISNVGSDEKKIEINTSIDISRREYESLIASSIAKTIAVCEETLKKNKLSISTIDRILLVGGPTLTPYLRKSLGQSLNIKVDTSIDPMTVVAKGAAIYASTIFQKGKPTSAKKNSNDKISHKLVYSPMTPDLETIVAGKINEESIELVTNGCAVEIVRSDRGWTSGKIQINSGSFVSNVSLRSGKVNDYKIQFFTKHGTQIESEPDSFSIMHGLAVVDPPLSRSIGVELENGLLSTHLKKGTPLPARQLHTYKTTKTVRSGESSDILNIHVYEGEFPIANRNRWLGVLQINGLDIKRILPDNSEVQVTLMVDISRQITAKAYIPFLDRTYENIIVDKKSQGVTAEKLEQELTALKKRIETIGKRLEESHAPIGTEDKEQLKRKDLVTEIETQINAARGGDHDSAEKARKQIQDLHGSLDYTQEESFWPEFASQFEKISEEVKKLAKEAGDPRDLERIYLFEKDGKSAIRSKNKDVALKSINELVQVRYAILFRYDEYWIGLYKNFRQFPSNKFSDSRRTQEILDEAENAHNVKDMSKLKACVLELWNLLSSDEQDETAKKVSDSGIRA